MAGTRSARTAATAALLCLSGIVWTGSSRTPPLANFHTAAACLDFPNIKIRRAESPNASKSTREYASIFEHLMNTSDPHGDSRCRASRRGGTPNEAAHILGNGDPRPTKNELTFC